MLDVGCGRGLVLIEVAKRLDERTGDRRRSLAVEGLDGQPPQSHAQERQRRRRRGSGDGRNQRHVRASVYPSTFDAVASMTAIHNVPGEARRDLALSEMARVLKPGGQTRDLRRLSFLALRESLARNGHGTSKLRACSCFGESQADAFSPISQSTKRRWRCRPRNRTRTSKP